MPKPREKTRGELTADGVRNFHKLSGFPSI